MTKRNGRIDWFDEDDSPPDPTAGLPETMATQVHSFLGMHSDTHGHWTASMEDCAQNCADAFKMQQTSERASIRCRPEKSLAGIAAASGAWELPGSNQTLLPDSTSMATAMGLRTQCAGAVPWSNTFEPPVKGTGVIRLLQQCTQRDVQNHKQHTHRVRDDVDEDVRDQSFTSLTHALDRSTDPLSIFANNKRQTNQLDIPDKRSIK